MIIWWILLIIQDGICHSSLAIRRYKDFVTFPFPSSANSGLGVECVRHLFSFSTALPLVMHLLQPRNVLYGLWVTMSTDDFRASTIPQLWMGKGQSGQGWKNWGWKGIPPLSWVVHVALLQLVTWLTIVCQCSQLHARRHPYKVAWPSTHLPNCWPNTS